MWVQGGGEAEGEGLRNAPGKVEIGEGIRGWSCKWKVKGVCFVVSLNWNTMAFLLVHLSVYLFISFFLLLLNFSPS